MNAENEWLAFLEGKMPAKTPTLVAEGRLSPRPKNIMVSKKQQRIFTNGK
jgi:hypothetical protein